MFKAQFEIKEGKKLYEAILPEQKDLITKRASVKFKLVDECVYFDIIAEDFASFRAMESAVMRLLVTFYKIKNLEA